MLAEPIRLYDYTYTEWPDLAHRNAPDWTQEQLEASWDRHVAYPVRAISSQDVQMVKE